MPQPICVRPFKELNNGHQLGPNPYALFHFLRHVSILSGCLETVQTRETVRLRSGCNNAVVIPVPRMYAVTIPCPSASSLPRTRHQLGPPFAQCLRIS